MNVLVATTQRFAPYSLRPKTHPKYQRYPLRSISNSCGHRSIEQPKCIPDTQQYVSKFKFSLMNDDCILHMLEYLPLADLCQVADTSVRLKELAQYIFRLKYQNKEINLSSLSNGCDKIKLKQVRSLFYNFGPYIKSLHVSRKQFEFDTPLRRPFLGQQKLFHLIGKYCCALETLTIGHFWFNIELIVETMPIFAKLRTLNFYRIICFCTDEKTFQHFGNVLPMALRTEGHQAPQMVQLI